MPDIDLLKGSVPFDGTEPQVSRQILGLPSPQPAEDCTTKAYVDALLREATELDKPSSTR